MAKNSWFKHYNTAHEGQTMSELWAENDTETIAFYWTILELVSRWESEDSRGDLEMKLSIFRMKLGMKSQRSRKLLAKISQRFKIDLEWISDKSFKLSIPNWLELQETRGGKREAKKSQSLIKKPIEVRSKNKEEDNTTTNVIDEISLAWGVWCETLKSFNLKSQPISVYQQSSLARAIKSLGIETVCLALEGQRYEKATDAWNPKDHLSLDRVLHRDAKGQQRWEKFANMALAKRELQKTKLTDEELQAEGRGF